MGVPPPGGFYVLHATFLKGKWLMYGVAAFGTFLNPRPLDYPAERTPLGGGWQILPPRLASERRVVERRDRENGKRKVSETNLKSTKILLK